MAEDTTLPAQESTEATTDSKPPKIVPLNGFPTELFVELQPDFKQWNQAQPKEQSFGAYLIHLIQNAAHIQEENGILDINLKAANDQYNQAQAEIRNLSNQVSTHLRSIEELEEESESLRILLKAKAKGREYALTVAAKAVINQAAELTRPGIFNRFQTMTQEQYELLFNQVYLANFSEEE